MPSQSSIGLLKKVLDVAHINMTKYEYIVSCRRLSSSTKSNRPILGFRFQLKVEDARNAYEKWYKESFPLSTKPIHSLRAFLVPFWAFDVSVTRVARNESASHKLLDRKHYRLSPKRGSHNEMRSVEMYGGYQFRRSMVLSRISFCLSLFYFFHSLYI